MSRGDYEDRQRERDREYADAWAKLSAKERRRLAKMGITGPDLPVYHTGKHDQNTLLDRCVAPVVTTTEPAADTTDCHDGDGVGQSSVDEVAAALRRVMAELLASSRTLDLECVSLVLRLDYDGASMTEIARRHRVTRAAVSKKVARYTEVLRTGIAPGQRKLTTRKTYARRAYRTHQQNDPHPDRN
jgi:predicted DNA-binding protein YlxM (UPF0122 family)